VKNTADQGRARNHSTWQTVGGCKKLAHLLRVEQEQEANNCASAWLDRVRDRANPGARHANS